MAGSNLLQAEELAVQQQQQSCTNGDTGCYSVYVNDYGNYGNWYDCGSWH